MPTCLPARSTSLSASVLLCVEVALIIAAVSSTLGITHAMQREPEPPRVHATPGPESPDVLTGLSGTLVVTWPVGGLLSISVPSGEQKPIRPNDRTHDAAISVSGPDRSGRIAIIDWNIVAGTYRLKTIGRDGTDERLIEERASHDGPREPYGSHIALSHDGKRVAALAGLSAVQMRDPDALLEVGTLHILDVETGQAMPHPGVVLEDMLAWTPDGKELAYTCLIEPAEAEKLLSERVGPGDPFGSKYSNWPKIPAVAILDLASRRSRVLHVGERAVISSDGSRLLVQDFELRWRIVDLVGGASKNAEARGAIYPGAIAFLDPNRVLYWAWPTEGAEMSLTKNNSPMVGPKQMRCLKVVDLRDGRFATLVPAMDPRNAVGVGQ